MTMFKTKEEIKLLSKNSYASASMDQDYQDGYFEGYTQAQQDIKEACNVGFDECFSKYATESNLHHEFDAYCFWQAAKLDSMKELREKDTELVDLKKALQLIYDNSRANYIGKQSREEFKQIVEKYKLHKY